MSERRELKTYIRLYRSMERWGWYKDSNTKSLFLHCLIKANYKENEYKGHVVEAGSFITSTEHLSIETGMTIQEIRTSLARLCRTGEIIKKSTNNFTQLYVVKWGDYQCQEDEDNKPITNEQQTDNKRITTTNKDKKEKKDNNVKNKDNTYSKFVIPNVDEVASYIKENNYNVDPEAFVDYYTTNGWVVSGKNKMKDWQASVRTWDRNNKNKPVRQSYQQKEVRIEPIPEYSNDSKSMSEDEIKALKQRLSNLSK